MQPRAHYLYELADLQRSLQQLADAVDHILERALRAFRGADVGAARDTLRADDEIDDRRYGLEEQVIRLIAAQQPLASDLRFLLAAMQVAGELERIGDYASGIATLVIRNADDVPFALPPDVLTLATTVRAMLKDSMQLFSTRDAGAAVQLEQADDQADALFAAIQRQMQQVLTSEPTHVRRALQLLFVAHNLERIADRAVNIAERATFVATGTLHRAAVRI
jgi:phosphate transport system protein